MVGSTDGYVEVILIAAKKIPHRLKVQPKGVAQRQEVAVVPKYIQVTRIDKAKESPTYQ